jgi:outer membrane autotransporter protein
VYGLTSKTSGQGNFLGDNRDSFGVVGGFAARWAPGLNVGVSVDQSQTRINMPFAFQSASMDLTQIGVHATYEAGPWTFAVAGIHGFAKINSGRRAMILGIDLGQASANYNGNISGGIAEVNYYWGIDQWRIVPKLALEYTRSRTDAFQEVGSLLPVAAAAAEAERARVMIGAEIGHYWILQQHIFDVSGYAKFIDNFHQKMDGVAVSSLLGSINVAGIRESTTGVDAGGMMSFGMTGTSRVYLAYDGKFRDGFSSHHGTAGLEVRF